MQKDSTGATVASPAPDGLRGLHCAVFGPGPEIAKRTWEYDAPARPDDAVPWQLQAGGHHSQRMASLTCASRKTSGAGYLSIGQDLSAWNHGDDIPDGLQGGIGLDVAGASQLQPLRVR